MSCLQRLVVTCFVLFTLAADAISQEDDAGNDATLDDRFQTLNSISIRQTEEHRQLRRLIGSWDVTMKDPKRQGANFTLTYRSKAAGFFVTEDYVIDAGQVAYLVHAVYGYDPIRKKFTGTWFTNVNSVPVQGTAEPDPDGKQLEFRLEHPLLTLKPAVTYLYRIDQPDDTHMTMQLLHVDENGKETMDAEFHATRSKSEHDDAK